MKRVMHNGQERWFITGDQFVWGVFWLLVLAVIVGIIVIGYVVHGFNEHEARKNACIDNTATCEDVGVVE